MIRLVIPMLLLTGCYQVDVTPLVYPSACAGDDFCERNLNARTLKYLGHKEAATKIICDDERVRKVMVYECGSIY